MGPPHLLKLRKSFFSSKSS